jgi:hypothetical protein
MHTVLPVGTFLLAGAILASASAPPPAAAQNVHIRSGESSDSTARFVDRRAAATADFAIVSTDGNHTLMLLPDAILLQLTDAGLARIAELPADTAGKGTVARLMEGMVRGGMRVLLDRGLEYDLAELDEVRVEGHRLIFVNRRGKEVFGKMEIDGKEFMEGFSPRDARAFAARVNRRLR